MKLRILCFFVLLVVTVGTLISIPGQAQENIIRGKVQAPKNIIRQGPERPPTNVIRPGPSIISLPPGASLVAPNRPIRIDFIRQAPFNYPGSGIPVTQIPIPNNMVLMPRGYLFACPGLIFNDARNRWAFLQVPPVPLQAGEWYGVDMDVNPPGFLIQPNFDPFVVVVTPGGNVIACDDNCKAVPDIRNARAIFQAPVTSLGYRFYLTTAFAGQAGAFSYSLWRFPSQPPPCL